MGLKTYKPLQRKEWINRGNGFGPRTSSLSSKGKPIKAKSKKRKALEIAEATWRADAYRKHGTECYCGCGRLATEIHHAFERSTYPRLTLHPANGFPMNRECHAKVDKDYPAFRAMAAERCPDFAALAAITPDVAAIMHPKNGAAEPTEEV